MRSDIRETKERITLPLLSLSVGLYWRRPLPCSTFGILLFTRLYTTTAAGTIQIPKSDAARAIMRSMEAAYDEKTRVFVIESGGQTGFKNRLNQATIHG